MYDPGVATLGDFFRSVAQFLHFWLDIFQRSASAVWQIANDRKMSTLVFAVFVVVLGWVVQYSVSDEKTVKEQIKFLLAPLLIVLFIMFTYQLLVTPWRIYEDSRAQGGKWHNRSDYFASKIPAQLSIDQQQRVNAIIEPLAGTSVIIQFDVDDPYRRAETFANSLAEVFRSANWQVTLTGMNEDKFAVKQGVTIRIPGNSPIGKTQEAVMKAFKAFPEHNTSTLVTGVGAIGDTVELFVGEL